MSRKNDGKNSGTGKDGKAVNKTIALNRSARHDYHLEDRYEAGIALQGWELKAIRAGRMNIGESYALVKDGELFLFGAQITPLSQASTHVVADDRRTRKLLMHRHEIRKLTGKVAEKGLTLVPLNLHFSKGKVKVSLALAKGKQTHDKRETIRRREVDRETRAAVKERSRT